MSCMDDFHNAVFRVAVPIAALGQIIQWPIVKEFLGVPDFLTGHLTNSVDVGVWATVIDRYHFKNSDNKVIQKLKDSPHRMAFAIAATIVAGTGWEIKSAIEHPDKIFDWVDQSLYLTQGVLYTGAHYWKYNQLNSKPKPPS